MASEPVTVVVTRRVRPGREAAYEAWLGRLLTAAGALPGYLGTTVTRPPPGGREYTSVFRFDSVEHLRGFEDSDLRRQALREVVELLGGAGYAGFKLPKLGMDCALGDYAVKLSSYLQPQGIGSYLRTHVGRVPRYDNSKIQKSLGLRFRDVRQTLLETVADLKRWGHLPPA